MTALQDCDTLCHMTSITIRQLHEATGRWVAKAAESGELQVTKRGRVVAKILPASAPAEIPYFARRRLLPAFRAARLRGGRDSTSGIAEERDQRVP